MKNKLELEQRGTYIDFVVDGESLQKKICGSMPPSNTYSTFLASNKRLIPMYRRRGVESLLAKRAPELPSGRVELYMCPVCFDYSDGVISASVTCNDETVTWAALGDEVDDNIEFLEGFPKFVFDRKSYAKLLGGAIYDIESKELNQVLGALPLFDKELVEADEYSCLRSDVLKMLRDEKSEAELRKYLAKELVEHFGMLQNFRTRYNARKLSKKIYKWWTTCQET